LFGYPGGFSVPLHDVGVVDPAYERGGTLTITSMLKPDGVEVHTPGLAAIYAASKNSSAN
jgi:hypothetical protein